MADYTTTGLLASIRRRAMLPSATATGTADADLLALANEELQLRLAADLVSVREEYFARYSDTSISGSTYRIPSRAIAQTLRDVALVDASGNELHLTRLRPEQLEQWDGAGETIGFRLEGGYLHLAPSGSSSFSTLRMRYHLRPSELTATASDYEAITAINTSTGVVTMADTTGLTGSVDLVSASPGFDVLSAGVTATGSTGTTLTFASLPTGLAVGDYVCVADKSPVPNIPVEYHPILAQRVAVKVLDNLGDSDAVGRAQAILLEMEDKALSLVTPRVQGAPQKIVNRRNILGSRRRFRFGVL